MQVIRDMGGDNFIMLGVFCHRQTVAVWLENELGLVVEEFNPRLRRHDDWLAGEEAI
jgi:hypothetical protein